MKQPLLCEENIVACLEASDSEDAVQKLLAVVPAWRIDEPAKQRIRDMLVCRERLGTTAIGRGIALPHCFSPDVLEPLVIFGVSPAGVPYPSLDGNPVHFIFALILPQNESAERTKREILQNVKWILCDRHLQDRLKTSLSAREIFALLMPHTETESVFSVAA